MGKKPKAIPYFDVLFDLISVLNTHSVAPKLLEVNATIWASIVFLNFRQFYFMNPV